MDSNTLIAWKELAYKMLIMLRVLLVATLSWDFFLTFGFQASQRALLLSGIGSVFTPYVIALWILTIIGMTFILVYGTYGKKECEEKISKIAYLLMASGFVLYGSLIILSLLNPIVAWPVILNYMVNLVWIMSLIYFKREFSALDKK
jgi:hypothetical protein